jgi:hypothetical protein
MKGREKALQAAKHEAERHRRYRFERGHTTDESPFRNAHAADDDTSCRQLLPHPHPREWDM